MKNLSSKMILQNREGKILLLQRKDVPLWVIPGGHLEENETPDQAVAREVLEETGLKINSCNLIAKYCAVKNEWCKCLYFSKIFSGRIRNSVESRNIAWFNVSHLPTPMTLYEQGMITDYLSFQGWVLNKKDTFNMTSEIIHQLKNPLLFLYLTGSVFVNQIFGSGSFKVKLDK